MGRIRPCLWFDTQAEEAANFYVSLFDNSRILETTYYGESGPMPAGTVLTIAFELDGQELLALNGGPQYTFSEAISLSVSCQTQDEVDHFWNGLGGGGEFGPCGWLKDRFGLSWQVVPTALPRLLSHPDPEAAQRVMKAMMAMGKLDIAELEAAAAG